MDCRGRKWFAALVLVGLLAGCVVTPAPPYYADEPVSIAPPPPRVEYVGPPPVVGNIWIGGYWNWAGPHRHYEWVPGYWTAPRPGYRWVPHQWAQEGPHWRQRPGYWERD